MNTQKHAELFKNSQLWLKSQTVLVSEQEQGWLERDITIVFRVVEIFYILVN